MQKTNGNENFDIPVEFCGQGVGVESTVSIKSDGSAYVRSIIKDGSGKDIGQFALRDEGDKVYLDLNGVTKMKRRTLVNVLGKLKDSIEFALGDQLMAESDDAPEESAGDEQPAGEE